MGTAFVFEPKGNYQVVQKIRNAGVMPAAGLRYVAAVTGPFKIFQVVRYPEIGALADRLDGLPGAGGAADPPNALAMGGGNAKVRRSTYRTHTALVRIDVSVADPSDLLPAIEEAIGQDSDDERDPDSPLNVEADVVVGDFDILACVVDDDEHALGAKLLNLRRIEGVERTVTLRVIDYVSTSPNAPEEHRVEAAAE
jgi:hypothetical protein